MLEKGKEKEKQVEAWVEGYCGDCKRSLDRVGKGMGVM